MKYWNVVLAALAIFACGVVTGGLVVSHVYRSNPPAALAHTSPEGDPAPRPENLRPRIPTRGSLDWIAKARIDFLDRIGHQLQLSDEQHEKIGQILRERQAGVKRISERIEPDIRNELRLANEEVRAVLTPMQQRLFERIMRAQLQQRRQTGPGANPGAPQNRGPKPQPVNE